MSWLRLTKDLAVDSYLSLRRSGDAAYRRLFEQTPASATDVMAERGHATATGAGQSDDSSDDNQSSPKRQTRGAAVQNEKKRFQNMPLDERRKLYKCQRDYVTLDLIPTMPEYFIEHRKTLFKKVTDRPPKFDVNEKLNEKVSLWKGDITTLEIDVIVNAANSSLLGGGGVDGCIHRAAGSQLKAECAWLQGCETGDCKITCGYKLPAKYVLHTVGPIGNRPQMLRSCYKNCLDTMREANLSSIAFPCISTGIYGYPNDEACRVALKTVRQWLEEKDNAKHVDRVIFCLFLPVDISYYQKFMNLYFPLWSNKSNEGADAAGDSTMDDDAKHHTSDHSPEKHQMSDDNREEDDNTEMDKPSEHGGSSVHGTPVKRQGSAESRDNAADGTDLDLEECSPEDGATRHDTVAKMESPVDATPSK